MKFSDSFWNEEIGDFSGWEILVDRLKVSRQVTKYYSDYLRQRSLIEESYGKSLLKLAKVYAFAEEIGSFKEIWDSLCGQTEKSGLAHLETSKRTLDEANKISDLCCKLRDERREQEEAVRNSQLKLKSDHRKVEESKKSYEVRCSEEIAANQTYHQEVAKKGQASKEAERAHLKYEKSKFALQCSESSYRLASTEAEETRRQWEKDTAASMDAFQDLEENRFVSIRESLWRLANAVSENSVLDDAGAEEMRTILESISFSDGVEDFIEENSTGSEKPRKIEYRPQPTSSSDGLGKAAMTFKATTPPKISFGFDSLSPENHKQKSPRNHILKSGGGQPSSLAMDFRSLNMHQSQHQQPSSLSPLPLVSALLDSTTTHQQQPARPSTTNPTSVQFPESPKKPPRLIHYMSTPLTSRAANFQPQKQPRPSLPPFGSSIDKTEFSKSSFEVNSFASYNHDSRPSSDLNGGQGQLNSQSQLQIPRYPIDSVDNIEYFNLSDTFPRFSGGGGGGGVHPHTTPSTYRPAPTPRQQQFQPSSSGYHSSSLDKAAFANKPSRSLAPLVRDRQTSPMASPATSSTSESSSSTGSSSGGCDAGAESALSASESSCSSGGNVGGGNERGVNDYTASSLSSDFKWINCSYNVSNNAVQRSIQGPQHQNDLLLQNLSKQYGPSLRSGVTHSHQDRQFMEGKIIRQ